MDRQTLERRILESLCEFYEKQGDEVSEELHFALGHMAEFLASSLVEKSAVKG